MQIYLSLGERPGQVRALLAIDTTASEGAGGRQLDPAVDGGRPFRPLEKADLGAFLDHPVTRGFMRELAKKGIDRAPFKLAALLDTLSPLLPRISLSRVSEHQPVNVSLVLDLGNSRSSAVLVESHPNGVSSVPLELRDSGNPFSLTQDSFGSRITVPAERVRRQRERRRGGPELPAALAVPARPRGARPRAGDAASLPVLALRAQALPLGRASRPRSAGTSRRKQGESYQPVSGRLLKHLFDLGDGLSLREDGPSTPADPRYAPRAMMLFALVEILQQAYAQINSAPYRCFQGREALPRVLRHLVITYPSAMRREELDVYEALVRNAVILTCHYLNIPAEDRPELRPRHRLVPPFLVFDEALAAQMVYVYQEIVHSFSGSMEELVRIYGRDDGEAQTLRIASVDIGGGTSDVMIAEYRDLMPGTGTALKVKKLFQDGISVAGDDVCRAIVEDIVLEQVLAQLPTGQRAARAGAAPRRRRRGLRRGVAHPQGQAGALLLAAASRAATGRSPRASRSPSTTPSGSTR